MSYLRILSLPILIAGFVFSACNSTKKLASKKDGTAASAEEVIAKIGAENIEFDYFNSSANLNIKSPFFNGGANAKIRMIKDSVIWVSMSKFGFEAGRLLITKDSIFAVERIQKTYIKSSFAEASKQIGFEVNFAFVEDFFLGNPYLNDDGYKVNLEKGDTIIVYPVLEDYRIQHRFHSSDYKLRTTDIQDQSTKVEAKLSYDDYQPLDAERKFSYLRSILVDTQDDQENEVVIKFSNPEINVAKSVKFTIPDNYTPRSF